MRWVMPGRLFSTEEYLSSSYVWLFESIKSKRIVFSATSALMMCLTTCRYAFWLRCKIVFLSVVLKLLLIWTTFKPPGQRLLLSLLLLLSLYADSNFHGHLLFRCFSEDDPFDFTLLFILFLHNYFSTVIFFSQKCRHSFCTFLKPLWMYY